MATPESETSFHITIASDEGRELPQGDGAAARNPERTLNRFVRFVASGEWAGNAFGALAFLWATGVLLGGFCTSLKPEDFWFATVMIFIEAVRIFSRNYRVDNQTIFGTTKALRFISSPLLRMSWRPQEGDEVVLYMGFWIDLYHNLPFQGLGIPEVALLVLVSQRPQWLLGFQTWTLLIAGLATYGYSFIHALTRVLQYRIVMIPISMVRPVSGIIVVVAVLMLKLRPRRIANLISSPIACKLICFVKGISAVWLAFDLLSDTVADPIFASPTLAYYDYIISLLFRLLTEVVLLLGSLQNLANSGLFGHWIDAILHVCFLLNLVLPLTSSFYFFGPIGEKQRPVSTGLSFFALLVLLMIGNMQIPAAVAQVLLSSLRFHTLRTHNVYHQLPKDDTSKNLVQAIKVFYVLALCQGSLYIMASILGMFSFFPCRSLLRHSNFGGRRGAKAIDLYYHHAYTTCMDTGLLAARKTMSLASFALDSLHSTSSGEVQLAGLLLLDNLLSQDNDSSKELRSRIINTDKAVPMLIGMLGWSGVRERHITLFAARVIAKIAGDIRIASIPGTVMLVSSLLDAGNQNQPTGQQVSLVINQEHVIIERTRSVSPIYGESVVANQLSSGEPSAHTTSGTRWCSWLRQWIKERWSIPEERLQTYQDSLPVLGMVILEKLACDLDNCAEMLKVSDLIPKIIGLTSYDQPNAIVCSSLHLVGRLASTGGRIGAAVRQKLWESPFLLDNLAGVFEDSCRSPEVRTLAMDIIAKLALDEDARQEIGSNQMIIGKILHAFLGRDGPHDLRMAAGEALVNLSMESMANCSAIMEESGYELVKDLKDMLCEPEYNIYISVVASLLQNLCAHSDKLNHPYAREHEHLTSTLPEVMENIVSAEGKQLEILIGLASQICRTLKFSKTKSQTVEVAGLVKKLVDTLNSNRKPSPDYPRMRRVIIEMVISVTALCPGYRTMFKDEGMMEALSKAAMTPSKVEKYRVISSDEGVVVESGKPLRDLVDMAKGLIGAPTPTLALN